MTHLTFFADDKPIRLHAQEPQAADRDFAAVLLLHGAGGNLDFWTARLGPLLRAQNIALYAPHYFDRTGTDRADFATIADGVHAPQWISTVDAALSFVADRPGVDAGRILLAGISLGGFLALALAAQLSASPDAQQRRRIRAVVEVSAGLVAPYASLATAHFPPTLLLHGSKDTVVPVTYAQELSQRLITLDVAHRTELLADEGHWFSPLAVPRLLHAVSGFLQEHLLRTSEPQRAL